MSDFQDRLDKELYHYACYILRDCATQTHTDWEKYIQKAKKRSHANLTQLFKDYIKAQKPTQRKGER